MRREHGFTLLEALVAMLLTAMVVIQFLGVRTTALVHATQARNWRLAREIAEEKMSELQAGAVETRPESGVEIPLSKYEGFAYKIAIGEAAVSSLESELGDAMASGDAEASERLSWQRDRTNYRKARERGMSWTEYQDKLAEEDYQRRMEEKAPSEDEIEEVGVVVYFPKMDPEYEGERDSLLIKARLTTLALSGLTPKQAQMMAQSMGQGGSEAAGGAGALPGGGGSSSGGGK